MSKEPTTLLDVTMVDSLTADNGYVRVLVEVRDGDGKLLITPFDNVYIPSTDGPVLRDIDLGAAPPEELEIRITGYKADGKTVVFTKKIANGIADTVWTQVKGADPKPDSLPFVSIQPDELYVPVDSVANLEAIRRLIAADSLVWSSSAPSIARSLGNGSVKGVVPGRATITASSSLNPSIRDSAVVHVFRLVESVSSIRLDPDTMTLYTGGASRRLNASILPSNADNLARFSSLADDIAQVDESGLVKASSPGTARIIGYPVGHEAIQDTCIVTVKTDKPVIDAGPARKVDLGVPVTFPLKVTQAYGQVLALKWDLDGDGVWEDSVLNADTARPAFTYSSARAYKARFQARDGETNIDSATVTVVAGGNAPLVVITRPGRDTTVNTPKFRLEYAVNSVPNSRDVQLEYGTHKVGVSETIAGETGTDSVIITLDTLPPKVKITSPSTGAITRAASLNVTWMVDSVPQTSRLTESLAGRQGSFKIGREAIDAAGNRGVDSVAIVRDTVKPALTISAPVEGEKTVTRIVAVKWKVDGQEQTGRTADTLAAGDGPKRIVRYSTDAAGNQDSVVVNVILDEFKPAVPVLVGAGTTPSPTRKDTVAWTWGTGGNGNGIYRYTLDAGTEKTTAKTPGNFPFAIAGLAEGLHTLKVQEGDDQGNWSGLLVSAIAVDRTAPKITISGGNQTVAADTFTVSATIVETGAGSGVAGAVQLTGSATGALALSGGKYSRAITLDPGPNTLTVTAKDSAGNTGTAAATVTYALPPFKVLIFNKAIGFDNAPVKAEATRLIMSDLPTLLKASPEFTADTTSDTARLSGAGLAPYDVLVLNYPSSLGSLNAANKAAILDFTDKKGIVTIHGASGASWPEFIALTGYAPVSHANAGIMGTITNEEPTQWINSGLPATTYASGDEWISYSPNPALDTAILILWNLDESTVPSISPKMDPHPIVWRKTHPGGGRSFHTGQGGIVANYAKTGMLARELYNALLWTAKREGP